MAEELPGPAEELGGERGLPGEREPEARGEGAAGSPAGGGRTRPRAAARLAARRRAAPGRHAGRMEDRRWVKAVRRSGCGAATGRANSPRSARPAVVLAPPPPHGRDDDARNRIEENRVGLN